MEVVKYLQGRGFNVADPVKIRGKLRPVVGGFYALEGKRWVFVRKPEEAGLLNVEDTYRRPSRTKKVWRIARENPDALVVAFHNSLEQEEDPRPAARRFIQRPRIPRATPRLGQKVSYLSKGHEELDPNVPKNLIFLEINAPGSQKRWERPLLGYSLAKMCTNVDVFTIPESRKKDRVLSKGFTRALGRGLLELAEKHGYPIDKIKGQPAVKRRSVRGNRRTRRAR